MAVEIMIILLERGWVVLNCPGRDSLEPLRPLDTGLSCKGSWNAFLLDTREEEEDMKRAMRLRNNRKLTPSVDRRRIED